MLLGRLGATGAVTGVIQVEGALALGSTRYL